ncbi:MAG: hypothetical protein Kow006_05960 [Gammaproteobacteria bacterium]
METTTSSRGSTLTRRTAAALATVAAISSGASYAANECRVQYNYTLNSGSTRNVTVNINAGSTKTINRPNTRFVINKKNHPVKIQVDNALAVAGPPTKWVQLNNLNQRDPLVGFYPNNIKLYKIECLQQSANSFANPAQLIAALKNQVPVDQLVKRLWEAFRHDAKTIAGHLKTAGFALDDIVKGLVKSGVATIADVLGLTGVGYKVSDLIKALKRHTNATGRDLARWARQKGIPARDIGDALMQHVAKNWQEVAGWLRQAGYPVREVSRFVKQQVGNNLSAAASFLSGLIGNAAMTKELREFFRATADQAAAELKRLRVSREEAERLLRQAGYTASQITAAVNRVWEVAREVPNQAGRIARDTGRAVGQAARDVNDALTVIDCVIRTDWICRTPDRNRPPRVTLLVPYSSNTVRFKITGKNLQRIDGISGLPASSVRITNRSFGELIVSANLRSSARGWSGPTSGTARLMSGGRPVQGADFRWNFTLERDPSNLVVPRAGVAGGSTSRTGGNTPGQQPDLVPAGILNQWSYQGQVELRDSRGVRYLYRRVQNNWCSSGMSQRNSQRMDGSGLLGVYSTRTFVLPNTVTLQIRNSGNAPAGPSTVQLRRGSQTLQQRNVGAIQPSQTTSVAVPRPGNYNRTKCVIRGGGLPTAYCYACLGDNGEDGALTMNVDSGNSVAERNEANNSRVFP